MTAVRPLLTTALVLGAALVAVPAPAIAAATCRDLAATIVGTDGARLTGTEGRDVVVTEGALSVDTLGGDDLVCVTGPTFSGGGFKTLRFDTGPGDDVVDGTGATSWSAEGELGAGADLFVGGPQGDDVTGGTRSADFRSVTDTEADTIWTGAGDDSVSSGDDTAVNADVVDLGAGDDDVSWRGRPGEGAGRITGGDGSDYLGTTTTGGTLRLDNAAGVGSQDGVTWATFSGLEDFNVFRGPVATAFQFVGGPADEEVTLSGAASAAPPAATVVELGAGDDVYRTDAPGVPGAGSSAYDGGPGRDDLLVGSRDAGLTLDLGRERLAVDGRVSVAAGFEDAHVLARSVTLRGTDRANTLRTTGCRQTIRGRGGRDRLSSVYDGYFESFVFDCTQRADFRGGKGRDHLRGSLGPDKLVGDQGRDVAEGRGGRDLCRAERTTKCERR